MQAAFWRFNASEQAQLRQATKGGQLYFWFNDIPVVEAASAARFLAQGYLEQRGNSKEFDFIVYAYYMMLYERASRWWT